MSSSCSRASLTQLGAWFPHHVIKGSMYLSIYLSIYLSMSTMYTSCDSPKNSDMPNISSWGFRTSQTKTSQIASMSHYKTSSRRRPVKIVYNSQICLRRKNRGKIGLKSCSLNGPLKAMYIRTSDMVRSSSKIGIRLNPI